MAEYARKPKRRYCIFCKDHAEYIDYKDTQMLRKFMTDRGKIKPRRVSGNCAQHQHQIAIAIKRAREVALVPYTVAVVSGSKGEGKGGRGRG
jgi:small subunit ribosomal protein S18